MSEQQPEYLTALKKVVGYRKNDFNLGSERVGEIEKEFELWMEIAALIKYAERRYQTRTENARTFYDFPQLRLKYLRQAEASKAASLRIRKYLTNRINEFSL
jgi:hypothetical protein